MCLSQKIGLMNGDMIFNVYFYQIIFIFSLFTYYFTSDIRFLFWSGQNYTIIRYRSDEKCVGTYLCLEGATRLGAAGRKVAANLGETSQDARAFSLAQYMQKVQSKYS